MIFERDLEGRVASQPHIKTKKNGEKKIATTRVVHEVFVAPSFMYDHPYTARIKGACPRGHGPYAKCKTKSSQGVLRIVECRLQTSPMCDQVRAVISSFSPPPPSSLTRQCAPLPALSLSIDREQWFDGAGLPTRRHSVPQQWKRAASSGRGGCVQD